MAFLSNFGRNEEYVTCGSDELDLNEEGEGERVSSERLLKTKYGKQMMNIETQQAGDLTDKKAATYCQPYEQISSDLVARIKDNVRRYKQMLCEGCGRINTSTQTQYFTFKWRFGYDYAPNGKGKCMKEARLADIVVRGYADEVPRLVDADKQTLKQSAKEETEEDRTIVNIFRLIKDMACDPLPQTRTGYELGGERGIELIKEE